MSESTTELLKSRNDRKRVLRLAALAVITGAVTIPAFADGQCANGTLTCPDGSQWGYNFCCTGNAFPYEFCACAGWTASGGYYGCQGYGGCC